MDHPNLRLREAVLETRETIAKIRRSRDSIGEQNTKAVIIEPILSALGWNIRDLSEVFHEYRHTPQDNPVDYALLLLGSPRLFVEAKDINSTLDDHRWVSQTVSYATVAGVDWCVLTNGDEYRLYNAHAPVEVDKKLFRRVRISDAENAEFTIETLDLLSKKRMEERSIDELWEAHFVDRRVRSALERIIASDNKALIRLVRKLEPALSPSTIRASLKRADVSVEFPAVSTVPRSKPPFRDRHPAKRAVDTPAKFDVTLTDLTSAGLIVPPLELTKTYKGRALKAVLQSDGGVLLDGVIYDSLSTAAGMARNSVIGPPKDGRKWYQTNGWTFWKYKDHKTGSLKEISELRNALLKHLAPAD